MKLVVKKKTVGYGVDGSDVAITDSANIHTLKEGSFIIAFDNGVVIKADGTFTGVAGEKAIIYHKPVGGTSVFSSAPIVVGKANLLKPLANTTAVAKVMTYSLTKATITSGMHSGVAIINLKVNINDPARRNDATVYTDALTSQADINTGVLAAINKVPGVTATISTNLVTITCAAGVNVQVIGLGMFENVKPTVTAALVYGDAVSYTEMLQFAKDCSAFDGNHDTSLEGIQGTFTKNYGVENTPYLIFGIEINRSVFSTGKTDMNRYGAVNYIAIPEGDLATTNEGFMDILKAATLGVSADTGAAGADASDN